MKSLMKPVMTGGKSRILCRRTERQLRGFVNARTDKTPDQGVHDCSDRVHDAGGGLPGLDRPDRSVSATRAATHQLRGFMIVPRGVHDGRKASATTGPPPMDQTTSLGPERSFCPSVRSIPAETTAAERRSEYLAVAKTAGYSPSPTWSGKGVACPQRQRAHGIAHAGSPCLGHGCLIAPSPPGRTGKQGASPQGSLPSCPSLGS